MGSSRSLVAALQEEVHVGFGSARITASWWHISQVTKRRAAAAPIAAPNRKRLERTVAGFVQEYVE
jgi:hypothetical protein